MGTSIGIYYTVQFSMNVFKLKNNINISDDNNII